MSDNPTHVHGRTDDNRKGAAVAAVNVGKRNLSRSQIQKIAALGNRAVSTLFMLLRNVKIYDADNEIFAQPLELLVDTINQVVAVDSRFNLQAVGTMLALNGVVIKVDFSSLENLRALTNAFKEKDMGGFAVSRPVKIDELKAFLNLFAQAGKLQVGDDGTLPGTVAIKVGKYRLIRESLQKATDVEIQKSRTIDRKKFSMTVYARGIAFLRRFTEAIAHHEPLPDPTAMSRIVRDFVDLFDDGRERFLGLSATRNADEYIVYHAMNSCLLAIAMGSELGFTREQLHDLGRSAMMHDLGMVTAEKQLLDKQGSLTREERTKIKEFPLITARILMRQRPLDLSALKCILAAYEAKMPYARAVKRDGEVVHEPTRGLGLFGRIVRVASTFDALTSARPYREAFSSKMALTVMSQQMSHEFDPFLLALLAHIVAGETITRRDGSTVKLF